MLVKTFKAENFRNLKKTDFSPCDGINIIYGENAQGKTNLIEGIWLFTGAKSFRGSKDRELISFGKERAVNGLEFFAAERNQTAKLEIENRRTATLNGIPLKNASELCENCHAVVFSPSHLSLIKDGPAERRKFINTAISQLYPSYIEQLRNYNRALQQRNAILKDLSISGELYDYCIDYEKTLSYYGAKIISARKRYLQRISKYIPEIYGGLSNEKEKLGAEYIMSGNLESDTAEELFIKLKESRKEDIRTGSTAIGPHRDDILFTLNGIVSRSYASQGQMRSIVLALKLSEAGLLKEITGEQPVALLDDVMSELDPSRQDYVLNHIKDWQVFITCCDPSTVGRLNKGICIEMKNGELKK